MNRKDFLKVGALSFISSVMSQNLFAQGRKDLPNVLLLGDSISIGYHPFVMQYLEDTAKVSRPMLDNGKAENCQGTTNGVNNIDRWVGNTRWDIIHFNFGLHDIKHVDPVSGKNSQRPEDPRQAEPKQYKKNLKQIVERLQVTKAKLIFANTTPYPEEVTGPLRAFGDVEKYNKTARRIMRKNDIVVNDLYSFVLPRMEELQRPNNVHFTKHGSEALGKRVADMIRRFL